MTRIALIFSFFMLLLPSCKEQDGLLVSDTQEVFLPLKEGNYWVYNVIDKFHDDALDPALTVAEYQVKEEVLAPVFDTLNKDTLFPLKIDRRKNENEVWKEWKLEAYVVKENQLLRVIDDNKWLDLIYPIKNGKTWDGAQYTVFQERLYTIAVQDTVYHYDDSLIERVKVVEENNFESFVDYEFSEKRYAPNIGVVQKTIIDLDVNNFNKNEIRKGTELYYKLIEYQIN